MQEPEELKTRLIQYLGRISGLKLHEITEVTGYSPEEIQVALTKPDVLGSATNDAELERRAKEIVARLGLTK